MKKILSVFIALSFIAFFAGQAVAGPSRAIIQEMGSVIANDEVNLDMDLGGYNFNVITNNDTTLGGGNGTTGGTGISSANIGLTDSLELRLGRLPGFRSYVGLPVGAGNNYGITFKGTIPAVSGLAAWLGYGTMSDGDIGTANTAVDVSGSSMRIGAAYTMASSLIYNATLGIGTDSGSSAGKSTGDVSTTEIALAALYPVKPTFLAGIEFHYASMSVGENASAGSTQKYTITATAPALGARVIAGNWTFDMVAALLANSIKVDGSPSLGSTMSNSASSTVIGAPTMRVNYKF